MILYNPTDVEQKFYHGHIPYVFKPKESRTLPDDVGKWGLKRGNKNLVEYTAMYDKEMLSTDMDYEKMNWRNLVALASARGMFKPSMKRDTLLQLLKDYDTERRTLQKLDDQEKGEGSS
jgi:hypothetical protein